MLMLRGGARSGRSRAVALGWVLAGLLLLVQSPVHAVGAKRDRERTRGTPSAKGGSASAAGGGDDDLAKPSEKSGHSPTNHVVCNVTGPCVPCSQAERDEDWSVCRSTGHRQPIMCLVLSTEAAAAAEYSAEAEAEAAAEAAVETEGAALKAALKAPSKQNKKGFLGKKLLWRLRRLQGEVNEEAAAASLETSTGAGTKQKKFDTFQSCSLDSADSAHESVSVLLFESVCALLLVLSGALVYVRQRQAGQGGAKTFVAK